MPTFARCSMRPPRPTVLGMNETGAPEVLTVDDVADLLRVDRKTVYEAIRQKQIPGVVHIGRAIRVHRATLEAWLRGEPTRPATSGRGRR